MLLACCRQRLTFKSDILWTEEIISFQSAFLRTSVCSTVSIISPSICHEVMGLDAMILVFWMFSFKPIFSFYSFTFIRRLFSSLLSAIRGLCIWGYWYFPQQSWFQLMLHPAQYFSWCTLHISLISRVTIYSLDSFPYVEPVCCSMSSSNCCFLTCIQVSQEAGQVVWYSHLFQNFPQFIVIHTVKGFGIVNKAEIDVFLELLLFWWSSGCWQFDLWFLCLF